MATKRLPRRREKSMEQKSPGLHIFNVVGSDYGPEILAQSQHWGAVWARIIALAWTDAGFKTELLSKDPTKVRNIIKNRLNYDLNNELDLIVEENTTVEYAGPPTATTDPKKYDPWDGLPRHKLTMYLPKAPKTQAHYAIAIAEYADTGRSYPFTSL
jgi:ribosomally synthesized peptide (two-chain TOMM family)